MKAEMNTFVGAQLNMRLNRRFSKTVAGFTLLEICMAVAIGLLMLSLAMPSVRGLFAEDRLRDRMRQFDDFAAKASALARSTRKEVRLRWEPDGVRMVPEEPLQGDNASEGGDFFPFSKDEEFILARVAARDPKAAWEWSFWPEGVREPVEVSYNGPGGSWAERFGALVPEPDVLSVQTR